MARVESYTKDELDQMIQPPKFTSGSNPYDPGLLATVRLGDIFIYDSSGDHPGWMYQWDGSDWVFIISLTLGS